MARAIAGLKDGKDRGGGGGIPADVCRHGETICSADCTNKSPMTAWDVGYVPQAWKGASIVTIYKKGDRTNCGNCRGISLLSIAGKIIARILFDRRPEVIPETQCGFRDNRSNVDVIFCLPQLQESALSRTDQCTWICRLQ